MPTNIWSLKCLRAVLLALLVLPTTLGAQSAQPPADAPLQEADPDPWPRVVETEQYTIAMYPPLVEFWDGRRLRASSAVEITEKGREKPIYGVVDVAARTRVDKDARLVVIDEFQAIEASLPSQTEAEPRLLGFLQKKFGEAVRVVSLDRLEAALAASKTSAAATGPAVQNDPPRVLFTERPAMLVFVDGAATWRRVEGTSFERLLNTRPWCSRTPRVRSTCTCSTVG